jgi:phytoene dehydrogenase-like protein
VPYSAGAPPIVVVGAGHNGLVAACYLARAGRDVLVLEARDRPGGGARTEETVPGYRFDTHSVAHNMINMTAIPDELDLAGAGLVYQEMDPFSIAVRADGRRVRFFRSVEQTVASIAEIDGAEADAYRAFCAQAFPILDAILPAIRGEVSWRDVPRRAASIVRALRGGLLTTLRDVLSPYESMLGRRLVSDLTRGRSLRSPRKRASARPPPAVRCSRSGRPRTTGSGSGTPRGGHRRCPTRSSTASRRSAAHCAARRRWRGSTRSAGRWGRWCWTAASASQRAP